MRQATGSGRALWEIDFLQILAPNQLAFENLLHLARDTSAQVVPFDIRAEMSQHKLFRAGFLSHLGEEEVYAVGDVVCLAVRQGRRFAEQEICIRKMKILDDDVCAAHQIHDWLVVSADFRIPPIFIDWQTVLSGVEWRSAVARIGDDPILRFQANAAASHVGLGVGDCENAQTPCFAGYFVAATQLRYARFGQHAGP